MLAMGKQAHDWREECRVIVNKGRGKENKHEGDMVPLRAAVAMLKQDLLDLRTKSAVRSDSDVVLITKCHKCQKAEKERDDARDMHKDLDRQLESVRR